MEISFLGLESILSSLFKKKKKCVLHACMCVQEGNSLETSAVELGKWNPRGWTHVVCGPDGFEGGLGCALGTGLSSGLCLPLGGGGSLCPVPCSWWCCQSAVFGHALVTGKPEERNVATPGRASLLLGKTSDTCSAEGEVRAQPAALFARDLSIRYHIL